MSITLFLITTGIMSALFMFGVAYEEKLVEFEEKLADTVKKKFKGGKQA